MSGSALGEGALPEDNHGYLHDGVLFQTSPTEGLLFRVSPYNRSLEPNVVCLA